MINLWRKSSTSIHTRRFYVLIKKSKQKKKGFEVGKLPLKDNRSKNPRKGYSGTLNKIEDSAEDPSKKHDGLQEVQNLIKKKVNTYYDPSNSKLNLALDNKTLFDSIYRECEERMDKRYRKASLEWKSNFTHVTRGVSSETMKKHKGLEKEAIVRREIQKHIREASISEETALCAISVGDLVALSHDSVDLWLIISCPKNLDSNSYTFVNCEGEVIFGPKLMIKLRFPKIIPKYLAQVVNSLVQLERKYLDIAPVGVSDATFSKSVESLPLQLQSKTNTDTETQQNIGEVDSTERTADFIVSQASSQLLINSDVSTFHVPVDARNIFSPALKLLAIEAFERIPEISQKLEILHRVLQYDENEDLLDSPRRISIFQLLSYLEQFDLDMLSGAKIENQRSLLLMMWRKILEHDLYEDLRKKPSVLGKSVPADSLAEVKTERKFPVAEFMALVLALRMQGRMWTLFQSNSTNPPLSVNILPLRNVETISKIIAFLKLRKKQASVVTYILKKIRGENKGAAPKYYSRIIQLFKDYISGNLTNDPALETELVSILRLVDKSLAENGEDFSEIVPALTDYSKVRAYELLCMLGETYNLSKKTLETPIHWSTSLQLPNYNVLMASDFSSEYYELLDKEFSKCESWDEILCTEKEASSACVNDAPFSSFEEKLLQTGKGINIEKEFYSNDPLKDVRESLRDIPVYCIDSEEAHEIDDGISIRTDEKGEKYILSVHVANPTSYVKPFSLISKIALSKGFTSYFPDGPFMMLPDFISKLTGLVGPSVRRTFAIEFLVDISLIDSYIQKKMDNSSYVASKDELNIIAKGMQKSATVKAFLVNNLPKGFTYSAVNEILNDSSNVKKMKEGCCDNIDVSNLFKLYYISTLLKDIRLVAGNGLEIDMQRSSIKVEYEGNFQNPFERQEGKARVCVDGIGKCSPIITISNSQDQRSDSKSQNLVSNFMISSNYLASIFARHNQIDVIHRSQELGLEDSVLAQLLQMCSEKYYAQQGLSVDELSKIISVLNSAHLQVPEKGHESLGVSGYATITSPLRRYVDMVNHWKFEEFLLSQRHQKHRVFNKYQLHFIANHLRSSEMINKRMQNQSNKFWEGLFFKQYVKLSKLEKKIPSLSFSLLLKSSPIFGDINVDIIGFTSLRARLESTTEIIESFNSGNLQVGQILEGMFDITKLDYIEGEIYLRQSSTV